MTDAPITNTPAVEVLAETPPKPSRKRIRWTRNIAFVLVAAALISAVGTYTVMTRSDNPFGPDNVTMIGLAVVNLGLLLSLISVVAQRAYRLWLELSKGSVGSRLQTRIVVTFSLITMVPTITVAVFAALFMHAGIQSWFSERVNTGLEESVAVAEAYLNEHQQSMKSDIRAIAAEVEREVYRNGGINSAALSMSLEQQVHMRSLSEAIILQRGQVIAQTSLSFALAFEGIPSRLMELAETGQLVIQADDDKIRAILRLPNLTQTYLVVGRLVDARVIDHVENAQTAVNEYRGVRNKISSIQIQFSILFVLVALLLLLSAIWYGMFFAARLAKPITRLVEAAERVRAGDYATRVAEGPENDELATLGRAFNRMTNQLASQRRDLMKANRQIDARRRFSEAVLAGVSAGVVAIDSTQVITLYNRSATVLLQLGEEDIFGKNLADVMPEAEDLLKEVIAKPSKPVSGDVLLQRGEKALSLKLHIAAQEYEGEVESFVITFDDITPVVAAQRHAAWADVARRVAHEIKNPLTPIQLSAQRLKRKYLKQVEESEQEAFERYTDTIIRHVGDIGKMVEEFVDFARLPAPVFSREDIGDLLAKIVLLEESAHPRIAYSVDVPADEIFITVDASQVRQVITNLVKNAAEAIETRHVQNGGSPDEQAAGHISVSSRLSEELCIIEVKDDGCGFPPDQIHRLLEPYVTTRAKGTGLGLAIVKKIMEDHKGRIELENRPEGGGLVRLVFPAEE